MVVHNWEPLSFLLVSLLLLVGCIEFVDCAKPKVTSTTKGEELKFQSFPVGQEKETAENIIRFQYTIAEPLRNTKHFQQPLLAYITPWNRKGYEMAVKFAGKFDFLSPVWYRIGHDLEILGKNDINHQWLSQMKEAKKDLPRRSQAAKILPRFTADVDESSISELMSSETKTAKVIDAIIGEVKMMSYDGVVLDFGYYLPPLSNSEEYYSFIKKLGMSLHSLKKQFILVIPPLIEYQGARNFETRDYIELYHAVDYFHMMTYDYHNAGSLGQLSNSPINWVSASVLRTVLDEKRSNSKLLVGINFYGRDFSSGKTESILSSAVVDLLRSNHVQKKEIQWVDSIAEHYFDYYDSDNKMHRVLFPTLKFIQDRLSLAESLQVGMGIWEIGQGLDYFFNIL